MKIWFYQTTESIGRNHRPLYVRPRKCHLLHNLHTTPEDRLRRSREMIGGPLSRESSRVSKQVASHFNFTNNFHHNMTICGLSNTESRKKIKKNHFLTRHTLSTRNQWTPLIPLIYSQIHVTVFPPMPKLFHVLIKTNNNPQFLCSLWRRANARNVSFPNLSQW